MWKWLQPYLLENSGGVKLTQLATDFTVALFNDSGSMSELKPGQRSVDAIFEQLEHLEQEGKIGILKYGYPLSKETVREKWFIYLPLDATDDH